MLRTPAARLVRSGLIRSSRHPLAVRAASTHAISNPTLANIEKRWEGMPLQEQADLWMGLRDRMKGNWNELTLQEQKAGACCSSCFFSLSLFRFNCPESPLPSGPHKPRYLRLSALRAESQMRQWILFVISVPQLAN